MSRHYIRPILCFRILILIAGGGGDIENLTLKYISYPDTLYNVTGTYGVQGYTTDKGGNRVAIPQYCWKVLLRTKSGRTGKRIDQITDASQLAAIGYWAENSSTTTGNIKQYITSVADIEERKRVINSLRCSTRLLPPT